MMKKFIGFHISYIYIGILIFLVSCQKTPINGNLDGEWEVMEVIPSPPDWGKETRLFYNFGHHVCQLTVYGGPFTLGNLAYNGEEMTLEFPFINTPVQELQLKQYGIFSNPVSFNVSFESKTRIILSNEESTVILRKF